MFAAYTRFVLRHKTAALGLLLVVVAVVSAGALRLGVDFSIREFFGRNDPEVDYLDRYPTIINSLTGDRLLDAARRHLDPERFAVGIAGPPVEGHDPTIDLTDQVPL